VFITRDNIFNKLARSKKYLFFSEQQGEQEVPCDADEATQHIFFHYLVACFHGNIEVVNKQLSVLVSDISSKNWLFGSCEEFRYIILAGAAALCLVM
jgi:hypothetical protein